MIFAGAPSFMKKSLLNTWRTVGDMRTSNYLPTLKHHLCSSMGSESSLLKSAAADTKNPGPTCWVVKPVLSIDWYYLSQRLHDVALI